MSKDLLNEMDSLFNHILKYYELQDKKAIKIQWMSCMNEVNKFGIGGVIKSVCPDCGSDDIYVGSKNKDIHCMKCRGEGATV